jgi:hypothetical protein
MSAWVDQSWDAQLTDNIRNRSAWLLDSLVKGQGVINLCVRWGATTQLSAATRDEIAGGVQTWMNGWFAYLEDYGCFPYPGGVTVKITGFAVRPGDEGLLGWTDRTIPVYTGTDREGEPQCPDACAFFSNWDHQFPRCPGGEQNHFDYSLWLDDSIGGGAAAVGGDWGLRMPQGNFVSSLGSATDNVTQHEIGHGFGIQDYYDWTGATPAGGSIMIVGTAWGGPTSADGWLLRRVWKEQKAIRGW